MDDYLEKKWNSLTDFKQFLERNKLEKILDFSGYQLVTNKRVYTLCDNRLAYRNR